MQYRRQRDDADGLDGVVQEKACGETSGDIRPYTDMRAYLWLFGTWLPQSGREPADAPVFEEYLNNPRDLRPIIARTIVCVIGEAGAGNWTVRGKEAATSGAVKRAAQGSFVAVSLST